MKTLEALKSRRSIRKYKPDPISESVVNEILDCARLAPSGHNRQPWIFVVITEAGSRLAISEACKYGKFIKDAPVCIAVFGDMGSDIYFEDGCAATENILLAAKAFGLGSCWVNSHKKVHSAEVKALLNAPEHLELISLVALGKSDEQPNPKKKTLNEVVVRERFS